jgi:hypothetical protein
MAPPTRVPAVQVSGEWTVWLPEHLYRPYRMYRVVSRADSMAPCTCVKAVQAVQASGKWTVWLAADESRPYKLYMLQVSRQYGLHAHVFRPYRLYRLHKCTLWLSAAEFRPYKLYRFQVSGQCGSQPICSGRTGLSVEWTILLPAHVFRSYRLY